MRYLYKHLNTETNSQNIIKIYTQILKTATCFGYKSPSSGILKCKGVQAPLHQTWTYNDNIKNTCTPLYLRFSENGDSWPKYVGVLKLVHSFVILSFAFVGECKWKYMEMDLLKFLFEVHME